MTWSALWIGWLFGTISATFGDRRMGGYSFQVFLTFGVAGFFTRVDVPELRDLASDGSTVVFPAYTYARVQRPPMGVAGGGFSRPDDEPPGYSRGG